MHSAWKSLNPQSQDKRAHRGNRSSSERGNLAKRRRREREREIDSQRERERERESGIFWSRAVFSTRRNNAHSDAEIWRMRVFPALCPPRIFLFMDHFEKYVRYSRWYRVLSLRLFYPRWSRERARLMRTYAPLRVTSRRISILKFRAISWQYHALVIRSNNYREC